MMSNLMATKVRLAEAPVGLEQYGSICGDSASQDPTQDHLVEDILCDATDKSAFVIEDGIHIEELDSETGGLDAGIDIATSNASDKQMEIEERLSLDQWVIVGTDKEEDDHMHNAFILGLAEGWASAKSRINSKRRSF